MYKNWYFIKKQNDYNMMPTARGIFAVLWYYPLFKVLNSDSHQRFDTNKVLSKYAAALYVVLLVIFAALENYTSNIYILLATILITPLFFINFLLYIKQINGINNEAYIYNSRWNIRNTVFSIANIPLILFAILSNTPLLPSSTVITQENIFNRDLEYLYRKKILPADETIRYFYSDAVFSIRNDGNGFTDHRVFSYWLDETDNLNSEVATFDNVKNIQVKYAKDEKSNTIVTITRSDDSEFILIISADEGKDKLFVSKLEALHHQYHPE